MGSEYSRFDQEGRAPWRAHFLQFDHLREGVSPYVRLTRHDQYQLLDTEYEAGVNWSGAPRWTLVAGAAFTDSPNFRPRHHLYADSDIVVASGAPQSWTLWATLQLRHDTYSDGARVNTLNPGLAWSPLPPIKLSVNMIAVDKTDAPRVHGRAMRVDHTLSEEFSWFVGYADAPEAELGRVVRTKTWFTGVTLDLNSRYTVRLGYTHDDRVDTYVRQMVNASVAYRF
jgi:YaiO family outer membrane protein